MFGKQFYHKSTTNFILVCVSHIPIEDVNANSKIKCRWIDSSGKLNEQEFFWGELIDYTPPKPFKRKAAAF